MAFKGDITLDGKEYLLTALPQKTFVNQMAPAIGQGESKYQDGTSWAAWIQKDWQDGNGKLDPVESGGFLYGEVDSRVPKQLILPQRLRVSNQVSEAAELNRYVPTSIAGRIRVGTGGYTKFAFRFTEGINVDRYYLMMEIPEGVTVAVEYWTEVAGLPGILAAAGSVTTPITPSPKGLHWTLLNRQGGSVGIVWIVMYPVSAAAYFDVGYSTTLSANAPTIAQYNGSVWATTGLAGKYLARFPADSPNTLFSTKGSGFFRFNGNVYSYACPNLYRWSNTNLRWDTVATLYDNAVAAYTDVTSAVPFAGYVYFSGSAQSGYCRMSTTEVFSTSAKTVTLFAEYNGLLYAANSNSLEYSDDAVTWEPTLTYGAAMTVGPSLFPILAMAGLGQDLYVATNLGLYRIAAGDFPVPVSPWPGFFPTNGLPMVNYNGALYIVVNGRILRYTEDGHIQDVWLSRDDDMLRATVCFPAAMTVMNQWLVVLAEPPDTGANFRTAYPTIWALQDGGSWHQLAILPDVANAVSLTLGSVSAIFHDRLTHKLFSTSSGSLLQIGNVYWQYVPDFTLNPYNDPLSDYAHNAWIEWDWFDSPIFDVYKDYESVTIIGENISSTCPVTIYWKDDDSTDWELLGIATSNLSTVHWTIAAANRPATRRFKLGMLLATSSAASTPRIRAIRVKYMPMLRDWYQWNLQIDVAGTAAYPQEGINGEVNTRTVATIHDDLETIAKGVGVYLYTDINGITYEVKVKGGNFPYTKFEYNRESGLKEYEGVWNLTLEQTEPNSYTP